jgi:membrane-associated phospholipid phosphatase
MRQIIKITVILLLFITVIFTAAVYADAPAGKEGAYKQESREEPGAPAHLTPFSNIGINIFNSFIGYNTFFHLGGIAATMLMVNNDVDYVIYRQLKHWNAARPYFYPSIITGTSGWLIISAPLFFYGFFRPDIETLGAAYAVFQSTLISIVYATLVKAVTGRSYPDEKWHTNMRRESRVFRFGFLRGGIFYGWPGGHVMITTAAMASLAWYYPDKWWIGIAGALLITYTTIGVTVHEGHWMSDNIAGILMGYAIGSTVGRSFRNIVNKKLGIDGRQVEFTPTFSLSSVGVNITLFF